MCLGVTMTLTFARHADGQTFLVAAVLTAHAVDPRDVTCHVLRTAEGRLPVLCAADEETLK